MTRKRAWLLAGAGGLVAAIVALVVFFDWDWFRSPLNRLAGDRLARTTSIGHLSAEWKLRPRIVLQDVQLGNAEWSERGDMFAAETVEIMIDLPQLLRGRLVIPELKLVKPEIMLERRADGSNNWSFGAAQLAETAMPDDRFEMPLIGRMRVENGKLGYHDEIAKMNLDGEIATAAGSGGEGEGEVRFGGQGNLNGEAFRLRLRGGSLLMLRETDQPYPLTIDVEAVSSRGRIDGTLADPIKFEGLDLQVRLQGPNLAKLAPITGVPLPMTPPYDLQGHLQRNGGTWTIEKMAGVMGRSDLGGQISIETDRPRLFIGADLRSKHLDYRDAGTLIGIPPDAGDEPAPVNDKNGKPVKRATAPDPNRRILPDVPLDIELVRKVDAKVKFRGEQVEAPNVPLSGVDLDLVLQDGVLKMAPLAVGIAGGRAISTITIDARKPEVFTESDVRLSNFQLQRFLDDAGLEGTGSGRIDGRIRLAGPGNSVRRYLANSNGSAQVMMNRGTMSNLGMELIGLDIAETLGFLAEGDRTIPIRCFVTDFEVQKGVMRPKVFVFDTTDTTVTADGTIGLDRETLNLKFLAHPKDPSPLSVRTPVTVGGRLAAPRIGVDPVPLAARGAAAVALGTLLSPFAAILAFIEPGLQEDVDCARLHADAQAEAQAKKPATRAAQNGNGPALRTP